MVRTFSKSRNYAILAIVLITVIVAFGANSSPVSADPCIVQLSYPIMPSGYSYSNIPLVVPMSATCTTYYGSQLYATGNAYDVTLNTGLGSVSTVLQSPDGGTTFNGQLGFNLPPSTQGHTVQLSVSIYNGQYGNQITTTSETIQIGIGTPQITTTTVTEAYPYQNEYLPYQSQYPYPYPSPSNQPYSPQPASQPHRNQNSSFRGQYQPYWYQNSSLLLGYVAIVAILVAAIVATAGLVIYGRRSTPVAWIPQPPPPR